MDLGIADWFLLLAEELMSSRLLNKRSSSATILNTHR